MPESTKKTERADAPRLEPQAAKPERLEKPQVRPQWSMKAPSEPPRPAKRYEGPPQAAPYIVTPDRTHVDAYWRSRHLQLDRHDDQLPGARRYPPSKTFQPAYANDDVGGYDDVYEDQGQAHAAPRRSRRREGNYGRTGRDLAIAAGLALSLSSVTGAAVYDRASGGQIAAAIMAPFGTDATASEIPVVAATVVATATAPEPVPAKAPEPAPAVVEVPSGKPIATAKLEVADASGTADEPVDLDLQATPGEAGQELELRLSGLPDKAYLTAGTQISPASWSLKPAEAAVVKLVLPGKQAGEFDLSVAAVEAKTGELVAPTKDLNVKVEAPLSPDAEADAEAVTPPSPQETEAQETEAAAPPPPEIREAVMPSPDVEEATPSPKLQSFATGPAERAAVPPPQVKVALSQPAAKAVVDTVATPIDALPVPSEVIPAAVETPPAEASPAAQPQGSEQARNLVSRGDHLMMIGDLAAAREFYLEALKLGAAPTTLLQVGMTYDPVVYEAQKVAGLSPDPRMALDYYRKADQAGVTAARDAIARLEAWSPN